MKFTKAIIFVFFLTCSWGTLVHAQETIRLTTGEWPPYLSKSAADGGIAARIVTQALALKGIKVEYGWFPWKRAFQLAERGEWDGSIIWSRSSDREELFFYSLPVVAVSDVFFHLKGFTFNWKSMDDLKGLKIGATTGYFYGDEFKQAEDTDRIKVSRVPTDIQNFKKLLKKRIDLFVVGQDVGYELLRQHFSPDETGLITSHPKPVRASVADLHLVLSKKKPRNQEKVAAFNEGLKILKQSGKLDEFLTQVQK